MGELNSQLDWIASYPKSGNTWVRLLMASYLQAQLMHYNDVSVYMFQCVSPHPLHELTLVQQVQLRNAAILHIAAARAADVPAVVKTHHANCDVVGMPLFAQAFCRKIIYVVRDPRDLVMSIAHHFDISPEEALKQLNDSMGTIRPERNLAYILGSWTDHVTSWMFRKTDLPIQVTHYEKLHTDTVAELRRIVEFMGWPVNEERLAQAVEENQFDLLQKDEAEHGFSEQTDHGAAFFRRGEAGSWRDELDKEIAREVERVHGATMRRCGYQLEMKRRKRENRLVLAQ